MEKKIKLRRKFVLEASGTENTFPKILQNFISYTTLGSYICLKNIWRMEKFLVSPGCDKYFYIE